MKFAKVKVGFIGAGAMAEALLSGIVKSDLFLKDDLYVSDLNLRRRDYLAENLGINICKDNLELANSVDIIFLAVKPGVIRKVVEQIGTTVKSHQLVVSIAAGITTASIEKGFQDSVPVIRVMPNTPCLVGAGASGLSLGQFATQEQGTLVSKLLSTIGEVVAVSEELLDTVTGLSGSGPAYMYLILEAMTDGAVKMGLPRPLAQTLAAQTMMGAAKMVMNTGEHPAKLKDAVTTPGGTTIYGLDALEKGNLRAALISAVEAATKRARDMAN